MNLARTHRSTALISLVPMVDVMLILLVFFMVTSTYLNLDMIPVVESSDEKAPGASVAQDATASLLLRIGADGRAVMRGQALDAAGLSAGVAEALDANPLTSIVVLPSGSATTQDLVRVMDVLTSAGATRVRLIRLEPRP